MNFEERFRKGLRAYIKDKCLKSSMIADKAGIRRDSFSKILNSNRRIFGDEVYLISEALGVSPESIANYYDLEPKAS